MTCHSTLPQTSPTMPGQIGIPGLGGWGMAGCEGTLCNKTIIRLMNNRPDLTTLQAWLRRPMKDSNYLRGHALWSPYSLRCGLRCSSFSFRSCNCNVTVSTLILWYTRHVVGPSSLCSVIGTPSFLHSLSRIDCLCTLLHPRRPYNGEVVQVMELC